MRDILLSTGIILAIGVSAALLDHVFMSLSGQTATVTIHKLISPAAYLMHNIAQARVTWL